MEPQKMRKGLKLLTLLISTLLIATASAQVYNYMLMDATVSVKGAPAKFVANEPDFTNCTGSLADNDQQVSFSTMQGVKGALTPYKPVNITNNDAADRQIELVYDSWDGDSLTTLYNITITMYNSTNTQQGNSVVLRPTSEGTSVTTSGEVTITGSATWLVKWEIWWKGTALDTDSVKVYLQLVVTS